MVNIYYKVGLKQLSFGKMNEQLQSISQNFCQTISNFVPKFAKFVPKFKVHIEVHKAFDWTNSIHGPIRDFYKPACEFQYELLNFATNLRTFF